MIPNASSPIDLAANTLVPVIGSLIADELVLMRRGAANDKDADLLNSVQWQASSVITLQHRSKGADNEIIIDSLEWMSIASRVVTFFQMQHSGIEDYLLRVHTLAEWAEVVVKSRELGSTDICFSTSGSTGTRKHMVHTWQTLLSEIVFFKDYFQTLAITPERVISMVPTHHIYGFLFTVMLPALLAVPVTRGLSSYAILLNARLKQGDVVIAYPALLQQLEKRTWTVPAGITLLSSTGPCPAQTLQSLQQRGIDTIIEVYGSSETAGIGVRNDAAAPYQLLPRWQRQADKTLFDYLAKAEVSLPDTLDWQNEQLFRPVGRVDKAVSVNGINVFPAHIAQQLARHVRVDDARVRLLSEYNSRGLKALLIVAVKLSAEDEKSLINEVHAWAIKNLSVHEIPQRYTVATSIPVNEIGKETDWHDKENQQ
ncbi:AMP-binding protein [Arsukibacterium sp. MJ3]|uniref:AMP-binding protein n=1 Tax=Arsukibacterium sp. MJ3 TaxID=1632859 RepID=UPI000699E4FF|nr:AMP-binding protein [Arsukibacterium sp. MJ3]